MKRFLSSGALLFISQSCVAAIFFGQGILVTRALGPAAYGVWAAIQTLPWLINAFLSFRTGEALTPFLVEFRTGKKSERLRPLFASVVFTELGTRTISVAVVVALVPFVSTEIAGGIEARPAYWLFSLILLCTVFDSIWAGTMRDCRRFGTIAGLPAAFALVQATFVALLFIFESLTLMSLAATFVTIHFVRLGVIVFQVARVLRDAYGVRLQNFSLREVIRERRNLASFWRFMRFGYVSSCLSSVVKTADILIIGFFRSDAEIGWYRLAKSLVQAIAQMTTAFTFVIYQDFNEIVARRDFTRLIGFVKPLLMVWLPLVAAGCIGIAIIAAPAITLIYGVEFRPAALPFNILLIGVGTMTALFWTQPLSLAMRYVRFNLVLTILATLFFIASCLILIPSYGNVGTAVGLAGAWVISYVGQLVFIINNRARMSG